MRYFLMCLLLTLSTLPALANANTNKNIILHYDFNGDATDKSGNGLDGTITGAAGFVASDFDQDIYLHNPAGQVNATNYVSVPNHAILQSLINTSFTWAIKYKTDDSPHTNGRLFGNSHSRVISSGFGGVYDDHIRDNSQAYILGANQALFIHDETELDANALTTDGDYHWAFIVLNREEKTFKYYVDDHLIVTKPFTDLGPVSFDNLSIGRITTIPHFAARFTTVDEVLIYDFALNQQQVSQVNGHDFDVKPEHGGNKNTKGNAAPNIVVLLKGTGFLMEIPPIDGALCYQAELINAHTNATIGSGIDCLENITPQGDGLSLDRTTYFNFPSGQLVARGPTTVQPFVTLAAPYTHVVGEIPHITTNSIVSGTKQFKKSSGRVRLSGAVGMDGFPDLIEFNCIFIIDLD